MNSLFADQNLRFVNCYTETDAEAMMVCISQTQLSLDFDLDIDAIFQLRNLTVVDAITVILPNCTMLPYSSFSQNLSHHENEFLIILLSKRLLPLVLFRQIINNPEFKYIVKNKNINIKDIIYENLQEKDGLIAVPRLFRGNYSILSPVLKDYLPELKRTATVKVKDKHKSNYERIVKFFLTQQVEKENNITYTLPDVDAPNVDLAGENLTFRNLREILDSFRGLENSNILREVNRRQFIEMMRSGKIVPSTEVWYRMYLAVHHSIYKQFYKSKLDNLPFVHLDNNITNTKVQRARFNTKNVSDMSTPSSLEQGFQTDISAGKNLEQFDHNFNLFKSFPHFRETNKKKNSSQSHSQQDKGEETTISYLLEQRKHHLPSENSYAGVVALSADVNSNESVNKALQNIPAHNENNSAFIKFPHHNVDFIKKLFLVKNIDDNLLIRKFADVVEPVNSVKIVDDITNNLNETFISSTNLTSINTTEEKEIYESTILKNPIDTTNIYSRKENIKPISTAVPIALTYQTTDKAEITINSSPLAAPMKSMNLITNDEIDRPMVDKNFLSSVNQFAQPNFINKNVISEYENYNDLIIGNFSLGNDSESQATEISVQAESSGITEESCNLRNTTGSNYLVEKIPYESVLRMTSAIFKKHQKVPIGKNCTETCSMYYVKLNGSDDEVSSLENGFLLFPVRYRPICNKTGILQLLPFQELKRSRTLDSDNLDTMKQKKILQSNNSNDIFNENQLFHQEKGTLISNSLVSSMLSSQHLNKFKETHPRNGNPKMEQKKPMMTEIIRENLSDPLQLKLNSDIVSLPNKNNQQSYPNLILKRRLNFPNYATPEKNDMLKPSVNKNLSTGKENQQFQRKNSQRPSHRRLKTMLGNRLNTYAIKNQSNVESSRNSQHVNSSYRPTHNYLSRMLGSNRSS